MSLLERRYRRMLRLLPAGYRQTWEEDMVSAFLESMDGSASDRPPLAERLSVVTLAVRLWLTGSPTSPRTLAWRQGVYVFALIAMFYQAIAGAVAATRMATMLLWSRVVYPQDPLSHLVAWGRPAIWLLWTAIFVALVLGRVRMAGTLTLTAATGALGLSIVLSLIDPFFGPTLMAAKLDTASQWGWFAATVLAVLLIQVEHGRPGGRARLLWLGAFVAGALVLVPMEFHRWMPPGEPSLLKLYVDLPVAVHLGLLGLIVITLVIAANGRSSPPWLLALALIGGGEAGAHLFFPWTGFEAMVGFSTSQPTLRLAVDAALGALAIVCAAVGVLALRRLPRSVPGPA